MLNARVFIKKNSNLSLIFSLKLLYYSLLFKSIKFTKNSQLSYNLHILKKAINLIFLTEIGSAPFEESEGAPTKHNMLRAYKIRTIAFI